MSPDLVPEYSNSANLSFDYWKQIGQWQINLLLEGFYTDLENVFALVETGHDSQGNLLLERVNEDGARVGGFNAEARIAYGKAFNLQGGYTFQKSKYKTPFKWSDDVEAQTTMYNSPDHYGYVNIDYIPVEPLTLSLNSIFTGPMLFQHYAGWVEKDCEKVTPTFTDLSFRVAYKVNITRKNQMEIFGSVKNILNQYQDDLDVGMDKDSKYVYGPATPRSYYFGIKFVF
jgi:outer membrane receptor for ferrienterochelin and colicins